MIGVALLASLAAVRFTPFVALGISMVGSWLLMLVRRSPAFRRSLAVIIMLAVALSAPMSVLVVELFPSWGLEGAINRASNGRLKIWQAMGDVYNEASGLEKAFGVGTTEAYYLVGGWPQVHPQTREVSVFWTSNPHNSYLSVILNLGIVTFGVLATALAVLVTRLRNRNAFLVTFYVLCVGITNAEVFSYFFPIYLVWLVWLGKRPTTPIKLTAQRALRLGALD